MDVKPILRAATAVQAAALLGENVKFARKRRKSAKDFVKLGVTNTLSSALLKAESDFINM